MLLFLIDKLCNGKNKLYQSWFSRSQGYIIRFYMEINVNLILYTYNFTNKQTFWNRPSSYMYTHGYTLSHNKKIKTITFA